MPEPEKSNHIAVLGSGNFGTCLAQHLASKGYDVVIWSRSESTVEGINRDHKNPNYLSKIKLSPRITASLTLEGTALAKAQAAILATPTQSLRQVLQKLVGKISPEVLLICAAKGIESQTCALPVTIIGEILGPAYENDTVVLSGPSFASEVVERQPTAVSLASRNEARCAKAQEIFHTPFFRAYTSDDPIGLEVAGALKNVIAIAAGACVGLGYQRNSIAALITRGLAEITRVGVALGANPLTFTGLGGVGDLFLTCTSEKSRNFTVGYRLGRGEKLPEVLRTLGSVAEGVATAQAAFNLARRLKVDAPMTDQVYQVLHENKPIGEAVTALLGRAAKPELTL